MLLLAASLFFTNPAPLDMPRATGYLVSVREKDGVRRRLEDRYSKGDLWVSQSVDGRWIDDEGRVFWLSHLDVLPPKGDAARSFATRDAYAKGRVTIGKRQKESVKEAVAALSPFGLPEKPTRPRQLPRGYKTVDYWQGTNTTAIVCAYLPEKEDVWRLATWELAEEDDFDEAIKIFEREFLAREAWETGAPSRPGISSERELLRRDAAHSVAAYSAWHVTDGETFVVLDDLPTRNLTIAYTNDLVTLRRRFAETLPTPIDGSNALCVARIYANRSEYLDALETSGLTNMTWSAAYWAPQRRELVAHASASTSTDTLLSTLRHESFHQYLSYATSMIATSPWLNEGYAQYFENENSTDWRIPGSDAAGTVARPTPEELERFSLMLPALLAMDYDQFYAGSDAERCVKYRLAWSVAVFLEKGAPKVRFRPYRNLKRDYVSALLETQDMRQATSAALRSKDMLEKFVGDWLTFWKSLP